MCCDKIIEWVVKVGGSLFPNHAIELIKSLEDTKSVIINGGGEFANLIRKYDDDLGFTSQVTHETAIDSMDIIARLLNDKLEFTKLVYDLDQVHEALNDEYIPILICSDILKELDPFEYSWDISSDSIAAYISNLLKSKLLIATNVDGIYTRKPTLQGSKFIDEISAEKLLSFNESSIDLMLPKFLLEFGTDCFVVNGKHPERVLSIINSIDSNHNFKYTCIRGD